MAAGKSAGRAESTSLRAASPPADAAKAIKSNEGRGRTVVSACPLATGAPPGLAVWQVPFWGIHQRKLGDAAYCLRRRRTRRISSAEKVKCQGRLSDGWTSSSSESRRFDRFVGIIGAAAQQDLPNQACLRDRFALLAQKALDAPSMLFVGGAVYQSASQCRFLFQGADRGPQGRLQRVGLLGDEPFRRP